ncbi:cysteine proteinase [Sporormia fimetaria CBS 119925]|uniref:Cysteine proteinase n=1 Tax=Sporormia fimetaria CBS 119925 TaxID=1340428 RepID=A0A6A6VBB8_9PLEO|nr:cysteine proteinase [Sporormia fimetaria CBS 119925]
MSADDDATNTPQQLLDDFWENLISKTPGKVTNIFPPSLYANLLPSPRKSTAFQGRNAAESYQAAADECRARVKRIVRECHRTNEKYTDPDFDIEEDLWRGNCLKPLMNWYTPDDSNDGITGRSGSSSGSSSSGGDDPRPGSVHRIDWIFEKPAFTVDGYSSSDVQQGANGDCWFLAAVASICSNPSLMHKVCVERDEECGVYGFVFYRDGEWISTVVDDNLYLNTCDFDARGDQYDPSGAKRRKWKKNEMTGSDALYFASCSDQNETWLPLLEKAYAKVHGDYDAISGGFTGEGIEDLTGGVTTKLPTNRVLSRERLWKELLEVNKQFLFSASSPGAYGGDSYARNGLTLGHAYSILKAVEEEDEDGNKHRLVLIRNPWGERDWSGVGEWNGAWSDGSKEWTPYWMNKLNYRFGDDGMFWMSYKDLLDKFTRLERTRLFDKNWTVVQEWTSVSVAWVTGYLNIKFHVEIKKAGPTVFVLAQLDDRYFQGLEGKYSFDLHFLLQEEGAPAGEHIVRARGAWFGNRSISAEVDLEPGRYEVLPKIVATKDDSAPDVFDVVKKLADANPQKLRQIGMNYDIANAKGITEESEEERKKREERKKEIEEKKKREREEAEKEKAEFEAWRKEKKEREEKEKSEKEAKLTVEKKGDANENTEAENDAKIKAENAENKSAVKVDEQKAHAGNTETAKGGAQGDTKAKETETPTADASKETNGPSSTENAAKSTKDEPPPSSKPTDRTDGAQQAQPENEAVPHSGDAPPLNDPNADPAPIPAPAPVPITEPQAPAQKQNPWNAVCVLGLRVYSQDPEVSIKLVKPKTAEEGAVLDADGVTAAGATM